MILCSHRTRTIPKCHSSPLRLQFKQFQLERVYITEIGSGFACFVHYSDDMTFACFRDRSTPLDSIAHSIEEDGAIRSSQDLAVEILVERPAMTTLTTALEGIPFQRRRLRRRIAPRSGTTTICYKSLIAPIFSQKRHPIHRSRQSSDVGLLLIHSFSISRSSMRAFGSCPPRTGTARSAAGGRHRTRTLHE
jgi:hypothetical protein